MILVTSLQASTARGCRRKICESIQALKAIRTGWAANIIYRLEWNPGLQEDCDAPLVGYYLCVMVRPAGYSITYPTGSTPVVIPDPTPYTSPPPVCPNTTDIELPPSPTQSGMPSKCQVYYHATAVSNSNYPPRLSTLSC